MGDSVEKHTVNGEVWYGDNGSYAWVCCEDPDDDLFQGLAMLGMVSNISDARKYSLCGKPLASRKGSDASEKAAVFCNSFGAHWGKSDTDVKVNGENGGTISLFLDGHVDKIVGKVGTIINGLCKQW